MDKLKKWLSKHKMTQRQFANQLGISDAMMSLILKGERGLTQEMMVGIYKATKGAVDPNDICGVGK